jgi:hypothetical protein
METAVDLITSRQYSEGFIKLWELKRLDLTVEAIVAYENFQSQFSPEIVQAAKKRLRECGYEK